jgi:hypothetical protein
MPWAFELTRSRGGRYALWPPTAVIALVFGSQGGPCDPVKKNDAG